MTESTEPGQGRKAAAIRYASVCGGFFMNREELRRYLNRLFEEASIDFREKEIPVACCLITSHSIYFSHNKVEKTNDPLAHAEMIAINTALKEENVRRLKDGILIVTLEPCLMCLGAIIKAGVKQLYYVLDDPKLGSLSHYHAFVDDVLEISQIQDDRFKDLMDELFRELRNHQS